MRTEDIDQFIDQLISEARAARGLPATKLPAASERRRLRYAVRFLDGEVEAETLGDLIVVTLRRLERRKPGCLEQLSQMARRKRRIVSRTPEGVYPGRPDLSVFTREVSKGWWVGTNYSRHDTCALS